MWGLVCKIVQVGQEKFREFLSRHLNPLPSLVDQLAIRKLLYHFKLERQCLGSKPGLLKIAKLPSMSFSVSRHPQAGAIQMRHLNNI
jgi:hypothetical protein